MKRFVCVLLIFALLSGLSAGAEEAAWETFETDFGFSFFYDAREMGVDVSEADGDVLIYPLALAEKTEEANENGFSLAWKDPRDQACVRLYNPYGGIDPAWAPPVGFEPMEGEWALPGWISRHRIEDEVIGPYTYDEAVFEGTDEIYCLFAAYPEGDPDGWGEKLWEVLETLEFPPQPAKAGSFRLDFFYGGAAGMQFIPVVADEEAEPVVLRAGEEVRDFVLERLTWDWDGEEPEISSAETLYAADAFGPGDNLEIFCWFSDVLADLRFRCVNFSGEEETWYLFQSGRDGSLLLLPPEEMP